MCKYSISSSLVIKKGIIFLRARENLRLYVCVLVCVFVSPPPCVCVFLNLTCLVLPELVTSGTSDSDSCSCKSEPLSLSFLFLFLSFCLSFLSSSLFLASWLSATMLLLIYGFVFTHAHVKLCLGFCPPLCMYVCLSVCVCRGGGGGRGNTLCSFTPPVLVRLSF